MAIVIQMETISRKHLYSVNLRIIYDFLSTTRMCEKRILKALLVVLDGKCGRLPTGRFVAKRLIKYLYIAYSIGYVTDAQAYVT